jgi:hypothetical protein
LHNHSWTSSRLQSGQGRRPGPRLAFSRSRALPPSRSLPRVGKAALMHDSSCVRCRIRRSNRSSRISHTMPRLRLRRPMAGARCCWRAWPSPALEAGLSFMHTMLPFCRMPACQHSTSRESKARAAHTLWFLPVGAGAANVGTLLRPASDARLVRAGWECLCARLCEMTAPILSPPCSVLVLSLAPPQLQLPRLGRRRLPWSLCASVFACCV